MDDAIPANACSDIGLRQMGRCSCCHKVTRYGSSTRAFFARNASQRTARWEEQSWGPRGGYGSAGDRSHQPTDRSIHYEGYPTREDSAVGVTSASRSICRHNPLSCRSFTAIEELGKVAGARGAAGERSRIIPARVQDECSCRRTLPRTYSGKMTDRRRGERGVHSFAHEEDWVSGGWGRAPAAWIAI